MLIQSFCERSKLCRGTEIGILGEGHGRLKGLTSYEFLRKLILGLRQVSFASWFVVCASLPWLFDFLDNSASAPDKRLLGEDRSHELLGSAGSSTSQLLQNLLVCVLCTGVHGI